MTSKTLNVNSKLKLHFFLLLAACVVGTFLSAPSMERMTLTQWISSGLVFSFLSMFPLLFFIPTVLKPTPRSVSWLGFFLLAYLVWAILKIFSPNGFLGGMVITAFNISTFFYVVMWLRPFKKEAKLRKKVDS
jgi:uncharacterized membrane protein